MSSWSTNLAVIGARHFERGWASEVIIVVGISVMVLEVIIFPESLRLGVGYQIRVTIALWPLLLISIVAVALPTIVVTLPSVAY